MTDATPPPAPGAAPGPPPGWNAPDAKKKGGCLKWGGIVLAVIVVIGIISAIAGGSSDDKNKTNTTTQQPAADSSSNDTTAPAPNVDRAGGGTKNNPAEGDVAIETCDRDDVLDIAKAGGTITNNSSKASNYSIHVEFVDKATNRRFGEGYDAANAVAPGQQANWEAMGTGTPTGEFQCRILDVQRYAS